MTGAGSPIDYLCHEILLTVKPRRYTLLAYLAVALGFRIFWGLAFSPWVETLLLLWLGSTYPYAALVRRCRSPQRLTRAQVAYFLLEALILTGVIHFAGLTRSVGGIYYLFIIVYATFFTERAAAAAITAACALLYSLLVLGELAGVLPRRPPLGLLVEPEPTAWAPFLGAVLVLTAGSTYWLIAYTVHRFAEHLRLRERELELLASERAGLAAELAEARRRAVTDGLTGLYNHAYFKDRLARELERAAARGEPVSLVLLDIDHFKDYNDTYGHLEGDRVLRGCARVLRALVREDDVVARYGGEEFAVLLPGVALEEAVRVAERIRAAVAGEWGFRRPVTVSAGVASFPRHARAPGELVAAADGALYAAKGRGRNRVEAAPDPAA